MRILYLHQYFQTPNDFGGTRSYFIAKHMIDLGHEVTMVYLNQDRNTNSYSDKYEGIKLIKINSFYSNKQTFLKRVSVFLKYAKESSKIAIFEDYDLIYATSTPLTVGIPALIAKYLRQKPYIFEVRDLWPDLPRAMGIVTNKFILKLLKWFEIKVYTKADHCIGLSPGIVSGIAKHVDNSGVSLMTNFSNNHLFNPKIKFSEQSNIKLIYTGAFGIANGLDNILNVAKGLLELGYTENNFEFHFYGTGSKLEHLNERILNENIRNCKIFKPVPKHELAKIFHEYDMGIMSLENIEEFYFGTSPNKFFDYLSSGTPIICNYPGWVSELIKKFDCGIAVKPSSVEEFISNLIWLSKNKNELRHYSVNCRRLAEDKFSDKIQLERLTGILTRYTDGKQNYKH